jgi:hypothetical protein
MNFEFVEEGVVSRVVVVLLYGYLLRIPFPDI